MKTPAVVAETKYPRVEVSKLLLDARNPRLAEFGTGPHATQFDLLQTLWKEMAVEEVAMSIAYSGYFEHEPLFVEESGKGRYVVIEGNRRLAAVELLLDAELRKRLRATNLPTITKEQAERLSELPVVLTTRRDCWRYLGFKHVNGPATWGSYAKAQYIAHVHHEYGVLLEDIAAQIGDSNSTVERMYRGLMIVEQAEAAKVFNRADIAKSRFYFNYIYTGMDYPGISSFLGLGTKGTTEREPVASSKVKNLRDLFVWLYGSESQDIPSLIQSQNPDLKTLDNVLTQEAGVRALRDGLPLSVAHDISQGDERIFRQSLQQAKQNLQKALGTLTTGYSLGDVEALRLAEDVEKLSQDLVDGMNQKRLRERKEGRQMKRSDA
jgi:hypothetical protein